MTSLSGISCNIQCASPEDIAIADGVFGQTYIAFTSVSGILSGDKIYVPSTGRYFRVKGIEAWNETDLIPHFEYTLVEFEEEDVT